MATAAKEKPKETIGETIRTVLYALAIAVVFRTLLFQPFSIPSGSMKETLLIGDYLFVSKYSYGYSAHSCPWSLCPIEGRIFSSEPERGDVIVFKRDKRGGCSEGLSEKATDWGNWTGRQVGLTNAKRDVDCIDYIKRLIGLPGDTIQVAKGRLYINGDPVGMKRQADNQEPYTGGQHCAEVNPGPDGQICVKEAWTETLPNGRSHTILNADTNFRSHDNTGVYTVPEGHYFFMGDNRDNSVDSRSGSVGPIPFDRLVGRAEVIFLSSEGSFWQFWNWRFSRFFGSID